MFCTNPGLQIPEPTDKDLGKPPHYFVLSCMDYRQLNDLNQAVEAFLSKVSIKGEDDYDHFVLAGACLGVVQSQKPYWSQTFWDHLLTAKLKLHKNIHTVLLIEHEDCGAYQVFFNQAKEPPCCAEEVLHRSMANMVKQLIQQHPETVIRDLNVRALILRRHREPDGSLNNNKWFLDALPEDLHTPCPCAKRATP